MSDDPQFTPDDDEPKGFSVSAAEWVELYPGVDVRMLVTHQFDAATGTFHKTFTPFIEGKSDE